VRDGVVAVTAATQLDHGLKSLKPGLAASLAARFDQRRLEGARLLGAPSDAPLDSSVDRQSLDVALERLGEIALPLWLIRALACRIIAERGPCFCVRPFSIRRRHDFFVCQRRVDGHPVALRHSVSPVPGDRSRPRRR